jgi:hypothetical protein
MDTPARSHTLLNIQSMQTTAIYWENWQTPFRGLFGGLYGGKWTWKLIDEHARWLLGTSVDLKSRDIYAFTEPSTNEKLLSRISSLTSDFSGLLANKRHHRFSLFPLGTKAF